MTMSTFWLGNLATVLAAAAAAKTSSSISSNNEWRQGEREIYMCLA